MANDLVTTKKQNANAVAIVTKANVPAKVQAGIRDLTIAFPAGLQGMPDEDRIRSMQIYAEAVDGFELVIVEEALRELKFKNPRNPFPPTAQDVHELCNKKLGEWRRRACEYYFGRPFGEGSTPWLTEHGPTPGKPGCCIPDGRLIEWLRNRIYRLVDHKLTCEFDEKGFKIRDDRIADLPEAVFRSPEERDQWLKELAAKRAGDDVWIRERKRKLLGEAPCHG
jgi:hypothetical protein